MSPSHNRFQHTGRPLTSEDLDTVEKELGIQLPETLRSHYLRYNGGIPERKVSTAPGYLGFEVHEFDTMRYPQSATDAVFEEHYRMLVGRGLLPSTFIPFAINGGGDPFCISTVDGGIYFHPMDYDESRGPRFIRLADSLEEFVEGLLDEAPED
jgi:cell wall assembly regulator SMI1